ncbi:Neurogenic locus Notch protein [Trichinella patagoniensis]|uniref:Neurogenic locus Notch protein n=1 Tax=Trichinella patagoniensis TaxID=990121 RepID=A0A0V1A1K6_9BILA|nr:Neurogenic locus Notch protein [Trichinella patagoniensis]
MNTLVQRRRLIPTIIVAASMLVLCQSSSLTYPVFTTMQSYSSCLPSPCQNGGRCAIGNDGFAECECIPGYFGRYCDHPDPCKPNPCMNNGLCRFEIDDTNGVLVNCSCPLGKTATDAHGAKQSLYPPFATGPQFWSNWADLTHPGKACQVFHMCFLPVATVGFTASLCEVQLPNACDSSPCKHGKCILNTLQSYHCECDFGYLGYHCERVDTCAVNPCENGGYCIPLGDANFKCICKSGFTGRFCEQDVDECKLGICRHGECTNLIGSYSCKCDRAFTGKNCDQAFVPCSPSLCQNNGHCFPTGNFDYICRCPAGFTGKNCEINIDDCGEHLCQNGGRCVDGVMSYTCDCPSNYKGRYCTEDVNECQQFPGLCRNGGTCLNSVGSFQCVCVNGWEGEFCETNMDDCADVRCYNGGTCRDMVASFYCECPVGFTGLKCQLRDSCRSNPCYGEARCSTNGVDGSYKCDCPRGFKGDDCSEDVDECALENPCENNSTCVNLPGTFKCLCAPGWTDDNCDMNIDECESNPCQNSGSCLDDIGFYTCLCMKGYTGKQCETRINHCLLDDPDQPNGRCLNNGVCVASTTGDRGLRCSCPPGFEGQFCEQKRNLCLAEKPCQNGGSCISLAVGYRCLCRAGYTGTNCTRRLDDCRKNPCVHGLCVDTPQQFDSSVHCQCEPGWTGQFCDHDVDECLDEPCWFNGTCVNTAGSYRCQCRNGTFGRDCHENVNDCASNPCLHGGVCRDLVNDYKCECVAGYAGNNCEIDVDECATQPCLNGGRCTDLVNGFRCDCAPGFTGLRCDTERDDCFHEPCLNGATCRLTPFGKFFCHCPAGFTGTRCELKVSACASNPCRHGATCHNKADSGALITGGSGLHSGYTCACRPGYTGVNCEQNVDECVQLKPCLNGAKCTDESQGFRCHCPPGFVGKLCEHRLDPCRGKVCLNNGKCRPTSNYRDFVCQCKAGFHGRMCEYDVDECKLVPPPCRNNGTCENQLGTFNCHCPPGFSGRRCEENIDDCASMPCLNGGFCTDLIDHYSCQCLVGFTGHQCETDIDDCASKPCLNGGTCHDYVNSYTCTCPLGFSGTNCQVNDEDCSPSSCLNGGQCVDGVNNFTCLCRPGFSGRNCQHQADLCESEPCQNGGTCIDHGGHYLCQCVHGFSGVHCEQFVDWCSRSPCKNDGHCIQERNEYRCECPDGWTGKHCDVEMVSCVEAARRRLVSLKELCHNGGRCEQRGNSHVCLCQAGFTGSYCEVDIDECQSNPCQNGARCRNQNNSFACICAPGYTGPTCAVNIDDCSPNPCHNGGVCYDLIQGYICSCPPGTGGSECEINENDCYANACHHGGTCVDKVGGFECICPPGYVGQRCEGDVNECLSAPCHDEGTISCVQLVNDYSCLCKPGFGGRNCEHRHSFCSSNPCKNGASCNDNSAKCVCTAGFYGQQCEMSILDDGEAICKQGGNSNRCLNGGTCVPNVESSLGYRCHCPTDTAGLHCEIDSVDECATLKPCKNGGICHNLVGQFQCSCPAKFAGHLCDLYDPTFPGGVDNRIEEDVDDYAQRHLSNNGVGYRATVDVHLFDEIDRTESNSCQRNHCQQKANNSICNPECNFVACGFDGLDCSAGLKPFDRCEHGNYCAHVFRDGKCDPVCNNEQCLFDGFDCSKMDEQCDPVFESYCIRHLGDGNCDHGCNTAGCNYDGGDCLAENGDKLKRQTLSGEVVLILTVDPKLFTQDSSRFLMVVGKLVHANVQVKLDEHGSPMIYRWNSKSGIEKDKNNKPLPVFTYNAKLNVDYNKNDNSRRQKRDAGVNYEHPSPIIHGTLVVLVIDVTACSQQAGEECFTNVLTVADFLGAATAREALKSELGWDVYSANGKISPPENKKLQNWMIALITFMCSAALIFLSATVLLRKRVRAPVWIPGFGGSDQHEHQVRDAKLQFETNLGKKSEFVEQNNYTTDEHHLMALKKPKKYYDTDPYQSNWKSPPSLAAAVDHHQLNSMNKYLDWNPTNDCTTRWSEADTYSTYLRSQTATPNSEMLPLSNKQQHQQLDAVAEEPRNWSARHKAILNGKAGTSDLGDVNALGPDNETPLMLAAYQPFESEEQQLECLQQLVEEGADLNAQTEVYKQTALMLAVRFSRVQAVSHMLQCGSSPTIGDFKGNTALHHAIMARNSRIVEILLNDARTDLEQKNDEGCTALLLEAKISTGCDVTIGNMLLRHDASVLSADNQGLTAVHWAASNGNIPFMRLLLQHGAECNVQDLKDHTPLFLAVRENQQEMVRYLLEIGADKELADQMDRRPRHVAEERGLVAMLSLMDSFQGPRIIPATMMRKSKPKAALPKRSRSVKERSPRPINYNTTYKVENNGLQSCATLFGNNGKISNTNSAVDGVCFSPTDSGVGSGSSPGTNASVDSPMAQMQESPSPGSHIPFCSVLQHQHAMQCSQSRSQADIYGHQQLPAKSCMISQTINSSYSMPMFNKSSRSNNTTNPTATANGGNNNDNNNPCSPFAMQMHTSFNNAVMPHTTNTFGRNVTVHSCSGAGSHPRHMQNSSPPSANFGGIVMQPSSENNLFCIAESQRPAYFSSMHTTASCMEFPNEPNRQQQMQHQKSYWGQIGDSSGNYDYAYEPPIYGCYATGQS